MLHPVHVFQILLPTIFTLHLHSFSFSFWASVSEEEKHMEMYSPQIIEFYNSKNSGKSHVM
jgi:glycogen synthase